MTDSDVLSRLREARVIPVVTIDDPDAAVPLAAALVEGGLPVAEITFRTAGAAEAIRRVADAYPGVLLGAGTVLSPAQAELAREAGARFLVAPGFSPRVVDHCLERGVPLFPGVCTPTEIEMALEKGLRVVKFFPAEPLGGLPFLKAIAAPYAEVEFIPTGGIGAAQLPAYLGFGRVVACGGSWMVSPEWIRAGQFDRIRQEVESVVWTIRELNGGR